MEPALCRRRWARVFFASRKRHCAACLQRTLTVGGREVIESYHRGGVCHLVGYPLALPLDVEMLRPGEGEVSAAYRLLERVFRHYPRFFDAVGADALDCEAPFFNFCLEHGKEALAVLKGDERLLLRDARLRFSRIAPQTWRVQGRDVEAWDLDGFETMTDVARPVRVLHTRETQTRRSRASGVWEVKRETSHGWWASTIPCRQLPLHDLWKAGHARWDIETDGFNTLVQGWCRDHSFKHTPQAILNFVLTLHVVYVLVQGFYRRNLKPARRQGLTLLAVARELYAGWVASGRTLPWPETVLDTS